MKHKLLSILVMILTFSIAKSQLNPNIDFESNSLSQWKCYVNGTGTNNPSSVTYNTFPLSGINTSYQNLYLSQYVKTGTGPFVSYLRTTSTNQKQDAYGLFPVVCNLPGGGNHSLKIGCDSFMSIIQGVEYKVKIPAGMDRYNLVFFYATVLEDPGSDHQCWEMPFFNVNVYDSANPSVNFANLALTINRCNNNFVPNLNRSGKFSYTNSDTVYYSTWTPANMSIKNMGGKTLVIRATGSGCSPGFAKYDTSLASTATTAGSPGSHFGYGYIDFNDNQSFNYNNNILYTCGGDTCFSITPPPGYKTYTVYDSATKKVLAIDKLHPVNGITTISLCGINKPAVNSVIKVALAPYSWYGFADTLTYYIKSNNCPANSPSLSIDRVDTTTCSIAVDLPVRGKNLNNISKLQGSIHWDTAYMSLGGIKFATTNINLNYNQIDVTQAANGYLTYNWSDAVPRTIADNDPLFTMVLYPKPNTSGGTAIWFDNTPNAMEIDTAIGVAAKNASFINGWIILSDTPVIVQNVNILICNAGCIPMHYQWYYNGVQLLYDTLSTIYPVGSGVYSCTVTYKNDHRVGSNNLNIVLPVVLRSFVANGYKSYNTVIWQTVSEINTSHFNVLRSTNARDFSSIGTVKAKGASEYYFTDPLSTPDARVSKLYYRLEIIDKDGRKSYSDVRLITSNNSSLSIAPNPAKDYVTISGSNLKQVRLLDYSGRVVATKEVLNANSISMPVSNLPKGIFMVQATYIDGSIKTEKLLVE